MAFCSNYITWLSEMNHRNILYNVCVTKVLSVYMHVLCENVTFGQIGLSKRCRSRADLSEQHLHNMYLCCVMRKPVFGVSNMV